MKRRPTSIVASLVILLALAAHADAAVLVDEGFEAGAFSAATSVSTAGDGVATVQSGVVRTGVGAARLSSTATTGSRSRVRWSLAPAKTTIVVEGDVRVLAEGGASANVPIVRLFDAAGTRLVNLYRQNLTGGKLYVNYNGGYFATAALLPLDTWRRIILRVVIAGAASTVEVSVDGSSVYRNTAASLGTSAISTLQFGNEISAQRFDIAVDDVKASDESADTPPPAPPGDTTAPETTIDSGPSGTVSSGSGTFAFSGSEVGSRFECRLDAGAWAACTSPYSLAGLANGSHTFGVRATDAAGNTDTTPAERVWTVALPVICDPNAPPPTTSDPGTVVVADGFEQGFGYWTQVVQEGDATVRIQDDVVHAGRCAARTSVTANTGSRGNFTKSLPVDTREVWADGWFNFEAQGVSASWNTPTFRFFSDGQRVLDVSRQNGSASLFVRYPNGSGGWTIISTGRSPALMQWYHLKIHVIANGSSSTVEVWLDDGLIFAATSATLGTSRLTLQMVGADHAQQEGVLVVDDLVVTTVT